MTELAGWISTISLAICALPQVLHVWRTGKTEGLSTVFLACWLAGELFGLIYIQGFDTIPWPLLLNYAANTLAVGYLLYKKGTN